MHADHRPQLRSHVQRLRDLSDPHHGYLVDDLKQAPGPLRLSLQEFFWLEWFDGRGTLREIQTAAMRQIGGYLLPLERFADLARRLDDALLLDGEQWRRHLVHAERQPVCIGCYDGNPDVLRGQLADLFTRPGGPGLPRPVRPHGGLRAALVPHIDYSRGGPGYAWGFKEVFEQTDASLFVIVGTSHYSSQRFTLTRKHFKTPLGVVPTDGAYIDRLVGHYGDGLFDDEVQAHLPEHSIELEVVLLQWHYAGKRPIRIVPLVVGSFLDATLTGTLPGYVEDVGRMIAALRRADAETKEPICYLISGDLAHIGPKFRPRQPPLSTAELAHSQRQDRALLARLEAVDLAGYCRILAEERDARAICGFPPSYTVLDALQPRRCQVLRYDRYVDQGGFESVSFASAAFYR